jgi:hypothetical protein
MHINFYSRWNAGRDTMAPHWLEVDLGREETIGRVEIYQRSHPRIQSFVVECRSGAGEGWKKVAQGTTVAGMKTLEFSPRKARYVRLNILEANNPTVEEFRVLPPENVKHKEEGK